MLKQIRVVLCFVMLVVTFTLAQEQVDTTMQQQEQQQSTAWNAVCPVDGEPVSAEVPTITYNEKAYGFHSPSCAVVFDEDPAAYAANLSEDGTEFIPKKDDEAAGRPEEETEEEEQ